MPRFIDLTGSVFGQLTVVRRSEQRLYNKVSWDCTCSCGNTVTVAGDNLRSGNTSSCGCRGGNYKHGHCRGRYNGGADSPTRMTWAAMIQRCTNPKHAAYERYGGAGVDVCDRWLEFENFLADMGERPAGTTLDRIDNTKGYAPDNCRWATAAEQYQNKRVVRDALGKFSRNQENDKCAS